jgi:hypothetical protein
MWIVSQDKDNIINTDNVTSIWMLSPLVNNNEEFEIRADDEYIATYALEERAKEVLQEIIKQKAYFELLRLAPTGGREQQKCMID